MGNENKPNILCYDKYGGRLEEQALQAARQALDKSGISYVLLPGIDFNGPDGVDLILQDRIVEGLEEILDFAETEKAVA